MALKEFKRIGFGQVEPNHLSAQRTGQIYAQLPAHIKDTTKENDADTIEILENGQYVKYDYANNEVNFTGAGEWMMVFNEVKLYDDKWRESYKDFAMIRSNYTPGSNIAHNGYGPFKGQMVPRVIKTNIGDIYTTNCIFNANTNKDLTVTKASATVGVDVIKIGDTLAPNATGILDIVTGNGATNAPMLWQVVKVYTMADGQQAVKIMRIK